MPQSIIISVLFFWNALAMLGAILSAIYMSDSSVPPVSPALSNDAVSQSWISCMHEISSAICLSVPSPSAPHQGYHGKVGRASRVSSLL